MANSSIAVTEGSGKNLATYSFTETSTKELSRVTLNNSSGTEITFNSNSQATAANSAPVVIASDRQNTSVKTIAMTTDTSAYASGELIADTQALDAFFNKTDGAGVVNSITIIDQDAQGVALYVLLHNTSTSMGTENSTPNISDANAAAGIAHIIPIGTGDYVTVSGTKIASVQGTWPVKALSGTDDLGISVLNGTGTPTFTATGLNMVIGGVLD